MTRDNFASLFGSAGPNTKERRPSQLVDSDSDTEVYVCKRPEGAAQVDDFAPDASHGVRTGGSPGGNPLAPPSTRAARVQAAADDDGAVLYTSKRAERPPVPAGPVKTPWNQDPRQVSARREGVEHEDFEVEGHTSTPQHAVHEEMLYAVYDKSGAALRTPRPPVPAADARNVPSVRPGPDPVASAAAAPPMEFAVAAPEPPAPAPTEVPAGPTAEELAWAARKARATVAAGPDTMRHPFDFAARTAPRVAPPAPAPSAAASLPTPTMPPPVAAAPSAPAPAALAPTAPTPSDADQVERLGRILTARRPQPGSVSAVPVDEARPLLEPAAPPEAEPVPVEPLDLARGPRVDPVGDAAAAEFTVAAAPPSPAAGTARGGAMPSGTGGLKPPEAYRWVPATPAPTVAAAASPMPSDPVHQASQPLPAGAARGNDVRIGLVVSEYHPEVTGPMLQTARAHAEHLGAHVAHIVPVAGVYDTPLAAQRLAARSDVNCIVVLGAVVKGETLHDEVIVHETAKTLQEVSLRAGKPLGFGVTGPGQTAEQAQARIGRARDAVEAVVKLHLRLRSL